MSKQRKGNQMIYTLYIHDRPVVWSSRIEVIDANIAALGSLAKWCRVETREG
jgi:hypothetical protein